jgi:predicted  nucleic acid-binding Zn ribbon protein
VKLLLSGLELCARNLSKNLYLPQCICRQQILLANAFQSADREASAWRSFFKQHLDVCSPLLDVAGDPSGDFVSDDVTKAPKCRACSTRAGLAAC